MEKDYSFVIAVIVAMVAVIGLVVYFGGSYSGVVYFDADMTDSQFGYELGTDVAAGWSASYIREGMDQPHFCSVQCGTACRVAYEQGKIRSAGSDCYQSCRSKCEKVFLGGS